KIVVETFERFRLLLCLGKDRLAYEGGEAGDVYTLELKERPNTFGNDLFPVGYVLIECDYQAEEAVVCRRGEIFQPLDQCICSRRFFQQRRKAVYKKDEVARIADAVFDEFVELIARKRCRQLSVEARRCGKRFHKVETSIRIEAYCERR